MQYDPLRLARETESIVTRGALRKYYRVARPGRWYGGIATADCCGCCLRCVFCWSGTPRDYPDRVGAFYTPEHIFKQLTRCAEKFGYGKMRVSGNEPTIGRRHLLELLELIDRTHYEFILESNGILIDFEFARQLSKFKHLHVRISIKGTTREEFSLLTGAAPEAFDLQLNALKNLLDASVQCHPAVMLSFSSEDNFEALKEKIRAIDAKLVGEVEEEYVFLYPHVAERLRKSGIKPRIAYSPERIPEELI
ncbi:MAG: radical SAM protein [Candidatus Bathyarchaeia archaeon]